MIINLQWMEKNQNIVEKMVNKTSKLRNLSWLLYPCYVQNCIAYRKNHKNPSECYGNAAGVWEFD